MKGKLSTSHYWEPRYGLYLLPTILLRYDKIKDADRLVRESLSINLYWLYFKFGIFWVNY